MIIEVVDANLSMHFNLREKARRAQALWILPLLVFACAGGNAHAASSPYNASPLSVPGTIPTAQYDIGGEGVAYHDIDATNQLSSVYRPGQSVDSSGSGVGWISAGEWLAYTVDVRAAGDYSLALSLSHPGTGGSMHVSLNGVNATGATSFPTTAGWGEYQIVTKTVHLNAGTQVMQVAFDANGSTGYGPGLGDIVISPATTPTPTQTPFSGTAPMIPGAINPAQYDNGGEGVAYHDNDAANLMTSGAFRTGVDARTDEVGWVYAGEWIEYTVNVSAAGAYTMLMSMSNEGVGGTFHVNFGGVNKTGTLAVPATGSWSAFQTVSATVNLSAGTQVMMIAWDSNGSTGAICGLRTITISAGAAPTPTQAPFSGSPTAIPGTIATAKFDKGGEGVAYHDSDFANLMSGSYRPGEGVDSNGSGVGWISAGEWLEYTINVSTAGAYALSIPLSHPGTGGTMHVSANGVDVTGSLGLPSTASWDTYGTITKSVMLSAGVQVLRIDFDSNGSTGYGPGLRDIVIARAFLVYDSTLYANKPNLSSHGIQPIPIAYAGTFGSSWYNDPARLPDQQAVRDVASAMSATAKRVVIDIEHWPLTGSAADVSASIAKYKTVAQWFKEAAPGCEVGYYGAPPIRDYWRAIAGPTNPGKLAWQAENDRLAPLAQAVDILFPSLYTFYSDQPGWVAYAKAQIAEARRYQPGKPVYVFLWPMYHDSNATLRGTYLPADFWRLELNTALQHADGVVLWGGWNNGREQWDESAPWWQVTKEFMRGLVGAAPLTLALPTSTG